MIGNPLTMFGQSVLNRILWGFFLITYVLELPDVHQLLAAVM